MTKPDSQPTSKSSTTAKVVADAINIVTSPEAPALPKVGDRNTAPNTTAAEDLTKAGQHAINLIWENTQMRVALSVIWASLIVSSVLAVMGKNLGTPDLQLAAIVFLFGVANLVTGFYFGRTNHERSSGQTGQRR